MNLEMAKGRLLPAKASGYLERFLNARGTQQPSGSALFRYRVTEQEFEELSDIVGKAISSNGFEQTPGLVPLWFLYAAEWWRRKYDGGNWTWKRIFDSLGAEVPSHAKRREWVEKGSSYWHLPQYLDHGRKYIGQVVLSGGVPLRLIESADGHISNVLKAVLRRAVPMTPALERAQIRIEVEAFSHMLAETFRQPVLLDLMVELVVVVDALSRQHLRGDIDDPIQVLDKREPTWRERLPMAVDSDAARRLLSGLLREAKVAERAAHQPFQLHRFLAADSAGGKRLALRIEVLSRFPVSQLAQLLGFKEDLLPASFNISLHAGDASRLIARAVVRGSEVRAEMLLSDLPDSWFTKLVQLQLSRSGETLFTLDLPGCEAPEPGVPWLFEDSDTLAQLIRVGSCKLRVSSVLALVPKKSIVFSMTNAEEDLDWPRADSRLVRLSSGDWNIAFGGDNFRVHCGADSDTTESLLWHGKRLETASLPAHIFVGMPHLSRVEVDGTYAPVPATELYWLSHGQRSCLASSKPSGVGKLIWQQGNRLQSRLSAVCLPAGAQVTYEPGLNPRNGVIHLVQWPAVSIVGEDQDVSLRALRSGNDWRLEMKVLSETPPHQVKVLVLWSDGAEQHLVLPFPSQGVVLVREDGPTLSPGQTLTVDKLLGLRARLLNPNADAPWSLMLTLRGHSSNADVRRMLIYKGAIQNACYEVRLFELAPLIRQMLGSVEDLDARVELGFKNGVQVYPGLNIARYDVSVEKDVGQGVMRLSTSALLPPIEVLIRSKVMALLLCAPSEPEELSPLTTESVPNGAWQFVTKGRVSGSWLLYPAADSACQFRPLAWYVSGAAIGAIAAQTKLEQALCSATRDERLAKFNTALSLMSANPGHSDWGLLQRIFTRLGHLPAVALDLWVALSHHPAAVTMAILHVDDFAERMSSRFVEELPFEWILITPNHWEQSLRCLKSHWQTQSERSARLFVDEAKEKLALLCLRLPELSFSLSWALAIGLGEQDRSIQLLRSEPRRLWQLRLGELFEGDECASQRLLRRSAENGVHWPTESKAHILEFAGSELGKRLLSKVAHLRNDFKLLTIAFPLMLAYQLTNSIAGNQWSTPTGLAILREYRDFDPDWFEAAYQAGLTFALIEKQEQQ